LLLDDPGAVAGCEGNESYLFVSEVVVALEASLPRLGHRARRLSFASGTRQVIAALLAEPPDVIFHLGDPKPTDPASEAKVTALLDLLDLPHTSESPEALMLAWDKIRAKAIFAQHAIPTPAFAVSTRGEPPAQLPRGPWIAKPAFEDGSVGVDCAPPATTPAEVAQRIQSLHERFGQPILIETFLDGREFNLGIVGDEVLPIVEVDFSRLPPDRPRMVGYETKWRYDSLEFESTHYTCPAKVPEDLARRLRELARATAAAFRLRRCARLDVRMDGGDGVFVLDVNPNPDLSPIATLHTMAVHAGWGFDGLVQRLLELGRAGRSSIAPSPRSG
jgi:D-alanine-D-alanine ligase